MKSWGQLQNQKMINRLNFERRKRRIRRWWYDIQDDGLDLASFVIGITALICIGVVISRQLWLHWRP